MLLSFRVRPPGRGVPAPRVRQEGVAPAVTSAADGTLGQRGRGARRVASAAIGIACGGGRGLSLPSRGPGAGLRGRGAQPAGWPGG